MLQVLLVNQQDVELKYEEKLMAHKLGLLHRAFSIFIFRIQSKQLELLIQQRAYAKYHSGGLWSNTCCGHPVGDKGIQEFAQDRLYEEMGVKSQLRYIGWINYYLPLAEQMYEHENDHLFIGVLHPSNNEVKFNPEEVADFKWIEWKNILHSTLHMTPWFRVCTEHLLQKISYDDLFEIIQTMQESINYE